MNATERYEVVTALSGAISNACTLASLLSKDGVEIDTGPLHEQHGVTHKLFFKLLDEYKAEGAEKLAALEAEAV